MPLTEKGQEIKSNMEHEYGPEKGERVFYASKNAGTIHGVDSMDAVPVAPCYGKDQSWPSMDPTRIGEVPNYGGDAETKHDPHSGQFTGGGERGFQARGEKPTEISPEHERFKAKEEPFGTRTKGAFGRDEPGQPSGMREPTDADPERLQFKSHEARNPVEERRKERERLREEAARRAGMEHPEKDAAPQPGEPGHEARELAVAHELEAMHGDAAEHESAETRKKERERFYSEAANQGKITGQEHQGFREAINQLHARGDAADTSFDQAMAGYFGGAPDFSGDASSALGGAPEVVTQRQMANFASNFNYGQKGGSY